MTTTYAPAELPNALPAAPAPEKNPRLTTPWRVVVAVLTVAGIVVTMNQVYFWNLLGLSIPTNSFLYLVLAAFAPIVLIVTPLRPGAEAARRGVPVYDILLIAVFIASSIWLALNGPDISYFGWSMVPPPTAQVISVLYWALVLEILRRAAGWIVALLALVVSLYPLIAGAIPVGFLQGIQYDFLTLASMHAMGGESILGLPLQTAANILVGFLLFGVVLQHTGGASFFNDLATSLFGHFRGGSAKVSVTSSAAMGMMSGSAVSNVLTTGPMTIPTMIKAGFSPKTAGAVEATASSGGSITPPIMGTAAFLMVSFVGVPYTEILVAASIPAFLYFLGIYLQVDGYAAARGLKGIDKRQLPRTIPTVIEGWPYILALAGLTLALLWAPSEAQVPFWVVGLLILIAFVKPDVRFGAAEFFALLLEAGKTIGQIIGIIAGVGLILGGLSATGVSLSLSRDLVAIAGENVLFILVVGALACFVLGMGLTISAAYVFLAIVMVPALTALDVNPIAAHLFVIYWASVSYITPPVGLAAIAASGISGASAMGTSIEAMKFGAVKYIVPFAFVLNPGLVAQAPGQQIALAFVTSIVSVFALGACFTGYLQFVEARLNLLARALLLVGGLLVFLPQVGVSAAGLAVIALGVAAGVVSKRRSIRPSPGQ